MNYLLVLLFRNLFAHILKKRSSAHTKIIFIFCSLLHFFKETKTVFDLLLNNTLSFWPA